MTDNVKTLYVYTIVERGGLERNQWIKVGVAFVNRDKSLNIRLDALPVNGLLHVRKEVHDHD